MTMETFRHGPGLGDQQFHRQGERGLWMRGGLLPRAGARGRVTVAASVVGKVSESSQGGWSSTWVFENSIVKGLKYDEIWTYNDLCILPKLLIFLEDYDNP